MQTELFANEPLPTPSKRRHDPHGLSGLYAITPEDHLLPRLTAQVTAALQGGVRLLQYRNKTAADHVRHSQAAALLQLCRQFGARLIINDDLPLALALDADGVHLGRDDHPDGLNQVRAALGPDRILGISCYSDLGRAAAAARAGASYLAFGRMYPSTTKPDAPAAPLEVLTQARHLGLPLAAIGGITLENASRTLAAGADMLAVVGSLFETMDIRSQAQRYGQIFDSFRHAL